ncbi:MAG: hypothetical protein EZS28_007710, partial [Streblomastix strix]
MHKAPRQSEVADLMRIQRCNEFEIALEQACAMGIGKLQSQAGTASNIKYWFTDPFAQEVVERLAEFFFINSVEINIDADMGCRVAKPKSSSRAPAETDAGSPHHITLMLTITPSGQNPPPFIIIGGLAKVSETLQHFMDDGLAYFDLCLVPCRLDQCEKKKKGLDLSQRALLVLDGHSTRLDEVAADILTKNNCTIITFPGAVTHILQPIVRVLARDFRRFYCAELRILTLLTAEQLKTTSNIAELKRNNIILATIDSSRQVTTILNCKSGFSATGLFPRSVDKAIKCKYVIDDNDAPIHPEGRKTKRKTASGLNVGLEIEKKKRKRSDENEYIEENEASIKSKNKQAKKKQQPKKKSVRSNSAKKTKTTTVKQMQEPQTLGK